MRGTALGPEAQAAASRVIPVGRQRWRVAEGWEGELGRGRSHAQPGDPHLAPVTCHKLRCQTCSPAELLMRPLRIAGWCQKEMVGRQYFQSQGRCGGPGSQLESGAKGQGRRQLLRWLSLVPVPTQSKAVTSISVWLTWDHRTSLRFLVGRPCLATPAQSLKNRV